jgi:hypothetical protein
VSFAEMGDEPALIISTKLLSTDSPKFGTLNARIWGHAIKRKHFYILPKNFDFKALKQRMNGWKVFNFNFKISLCDGIKLYAITSSEHHRKVS